jgi:hypothetical protein
MKNTETIIPQEVHPRQLGLDLPVSLHRGRQKPQISSIPNISPKERNRYRVSLGTQILGTHLTIDEALKLVKRGGQ